MKRVFTVFPSLILVCSIAGCRNSEERKGQMSSSRSTVQEETEGDLFSIRIKEPYPGNGDDCLERANEEWGKC